MPIPPIQNQLAQMLVGSFCENRVPKELQDQVQIFYKIRGNNITIFESRSVHLPSYEPYISEMKIAQIRFCNETKMFELFYSDSNEKWWAYDLESLELEDILEEIDKDPTSIFWG